MYELQVSWKFLYEERNNISQTLYVLLFEISKLIQGKDCCERWEKRPQKKGHNSRKNCAITAITKISYNLSVIAQILEDDYKEAEEEEDWWKSSNSESPLYKEGGAAEKPWRVIALLCNPNRSNLPSHSVRHLLSKGGSRNMKALFIKRVSRLKSRDGWLPCFVIRTEAILRLIPFAASLQKEADGILSILIWKQIMS